MMSQESQVPTGEDISSCIQVLDPSGPFILPEGTVYRDVKADILAYNALASHKSIFDLLHKSEIFLQRKFGRISITEIYLCRTPGQSPELIAKGKCRCGNSITAPLGRLIDGSLIDCGCNTPISPEYADKITIYQTDAPNRWSTTVDGIQWLGTRYLWFVTFTLGHNCYVKKYATTAKEALEIRRDAEKKYFGKSIIDQYYDVMLAELEALERYYVQRHPPKIPGIIHDEENNRWRVRLIYQNRIIFSKSYRDRKTAVQEKMKVEKRLFGETMISERYYK